MLRAAKLEWARLVRRSSLKLSAKIVAAALADRHNTDTGQCNPSPETLADDCGISERAVDGALPELERAGFIEILRQRGRDGRQAGNRYRLILRTKDLRSGPKTRTQSVSSQNARLGPDQDEGFAPEPLKGEPTQEPERERPRTQTEMLLALEGGKKEQPPAPLPEAADVEILEPARHPSEYLASAGCAIESYQPGADMVSFATEHAPTMLTAAGELRRDIIEKFRADVPNRPWSVKDYDAALRKWLLSCHSREPVDNSARLRAGLAAALDGERRRPSGPPPEDSPHPFPSEADFGWLRDNRPQNPTHENRCRCQAYEYAANAVTRRTGERRPPIADVLTEAPAHYRR